MALKLNRARKLWKSLGPGLITGAADDEPSGIATYTIAGALYGLKTLWMALYSLPLMIVIQEMAARIGRVSNRGLAGNIKLHYPKWVAYLVASLIVTVNTVNIGADISGMADALALVMPLSEKVGAIIMTIVILFIVVVLPYQKIFNIFKWLALSLFSYLFAAFMFNHDWPNIFKHLLIPHFEFDANYFLMMTAFFGTTIAPYLFFWQANQEIEEKLIEQCKPGRVCRLKPVSEEELDKLRIDTRVGMTFSNLITFFIIIMASATLFQAGHGNVESLKDAAQALKPLAGEYSYLLFTLGLLSAGFLAIPILAGSAAYVISEIFEWEQGLNKTFTKAKEFYGIIIGSTLLGLLVPILGFDPVKALFYTSILYGIISPVIIYIIIKMANNKKIMGQHTNTRIMNGFAYTAFAVMTFVGLASLLSL